METIYQRPRDYDLEHEGDDEDVAFYVRRLEKWRPRRVMELASGSGRVTIPLARAAAASGVEIVGLEREASMLEAAYLKRAALSDTERKCLSFLEADMRDWMTADQFDLVIAPCSSLSHLLTVDEQISTWQCAYRNLRTGGRLVADLTMLPFLTRDRGGATDWSPRCFLALQNQTDCLEFVPNMAEEKRFAGVVENDLAYLSACPISFLHPTVAWQRPESSGCGRWRSSCDGQLQPSSQVERIGVFDV